MNLDDRLSGRVVLVTGGGSGLGKGACQRIVAEGGAVAVADIREALADETVAELKESGGRAIAVACDVADEGQVAEAVQRTVSEFGRLDGLVANAGTAGGGWIHELTLEDWNFVLGVNLTGAFLCAKHVIPHMLEAGGGSIVVTSSIAGSVIGAGGSAVSYAVSKAGIIQLARQIAVDYGSRGIRANAIQPAGIQDSQLGQHAAEDRRGMSTRMDPEDPLPRPKAWLPIRRAGHPRDEYGATVAFLLSDDSGYITGAAIPVDGGYLAT
jgi:3-oxoacyl-[acyl-carrier protein] reductase